MSQGFDINSTVHFEWKKGAGVQLLRSPGVGAYIKELNDGVYNRANMATPVNPAMYNKNYYHETRMSGKKSIWLGRVWCGNWWSMFYNKQHNVLLKSLK